MLDRAALDPERAMGAGSLATLHSPVPLPILGHANAPDF